MTVCLRRSLTVLQTFSRSAQIRRLSQSATLKNLSVPQADGEPKVFSPKIEELANSIAKLNLIEVAELSDLLKKKLNLPDAPAVNFGMLAAAGAAQAEKTEEEEQPQNIQTLFSVKLIKYDQAQKVALIKEIKNLMSGMNLVQAKAFVESTPVLVKEELGKEEAEKLKEALVKVGAEIEIV